MMSVDGTDTRFILAKVTLLSLWPLNDTHSCELLAPPTASSRKDNKARLGLGSSSSSTRISLYSTYIMFHDSALCTFEDFLFFSFSWFRCVSSCISSNRACDPKIILRFDRDIFCKKNVEKIVAVATGTSCQDAREIDLIILSFLLPQVF